MDTAEALKKAMQAIKEAEIPESLWATALPLALADVRGVETTPVGPDPGAASTSKFVVPPGSESAPAVKKKRAAKRASSASKGSASPSVGSVLVGLPDQTELFNRVSKETGVTTDDLGDVFHIDGGVLELKVVSRNLGENKKAAMMNVAALLGGLVFAGTNHTRIPFKDINGVCKVKHVHDVANGSTNLKATPGFAAVGSGLNQALTSKSGWQREFANAVNRVLEKDISKPG